MLLFYCLNLLMLKLVKEWIYLIGLDFEIKLMDVIRFIVWFEYYYIMNK